jgi:Na+/phosphate symporter
MMAFYWSLQTLATVGFGDINFFTVQERIFSIGWMVFGIGFYSYAIGNMTNLIAAMDSSNEEL